MTPTEIDIKHKAKYYALLKEYDRVCYLLDRANENGNNIHPDYNTLALRDVAKLYAKYAALYNAQHEYHAVIAGALFDFMGWLTSRPKRIILSSVDDASPAVDAIKDFAKMRGLSLDDAKVQDWQDILKLMETEK